MKKKTNKKKLCTHAAHIFFTGRVQGVGFRYTAEAIAHEIGLVGWVKNIPCGRVEVQCEGTEAMIDEFMDQIRGSSLGKYIQGCELSWMTPGNKFKDFRVEFHI